LSELLAELSRQLAHALQEILPTLTASSAN
jgi:hypothetical protein